MLEKSKDVFTRVGQMTRNRCKQTLADFVNGVLKAKNLLALIMNLCRLAPMTVCLNSDFYLLLKMQESRMESKKYPATVNCIFFNKKNAIVSFELQTTKVSDIIS